MKSGEMETHEGIMNRTGIMTHPELSAELIRDTKESVPSSEGDATQIAGHRAEYLEEGALIGSKPGLMQEGEKEEGVADAADAVLLDKLGERLAFERQGTRLYEAMINKCELVCEDGGPSVGELQEIYQEGAFPVAAESHHGDGWGCHGTDAVGGCGGCAFPRYRSDRERSKNHNGGVPAGHVERRVGR
jgi:hypothetical protein